MSDQRSNVGGEAGATDNPSGTPAFDLSPALEILAQWPRPLRRSRRAVLFVALALVVGACRSGGDGGKGGADSLPREDGLPATCWSVPQAGSTTPGGPTDPRATTVAAIAARPEESTGRARFATSTCLTLAEGRGDHQLWVSEGVADFDRNLFRFRMKSLDPGDRTRSCFYEHVVVGDRYWGRGRACSEDRPDADRWQGPGTLTTDEPRLFTPSIPGIINGRYEHKDDPYKLSVAVRRQIVDALIAGFEPAGTEELHGAPTWRYQLTLDKDRATGSSRRTFPPNWPGTSTTVRPTARSTSGSTAKAGCADSSL